MSDEQALVAVEGAAQLVGQAAEALEQTIRAAHEQGFSLRRIAEAADLSHETVRRILSPTS